MFTPETFSMNNGILLSSTQYNPDMPNNHWDSAHLSVLHNYAGTVDKGTHLGSIDTLLSTIGLDYMPTKTFWALDNYDNVRTVTSSNGIVTYDVSLADSGNKAKIVSFEAVRPDKPGIDGSPIYLILDKRLVGANAILNFSNFAGIELLTVADPVQLSPGQYRYECVIGGENNRNRFLNTDYLYVGAYLFNHGPALESEYNKQFDDAGLSGGAIYKFYNTIGNAINQKKFSVTRKAAFTMVNGDSGLTHSLDQFTKMLKIDFYGGSHPNFADKSSFAQYVSANYGGKDGYANFAKKNIFHTAIVSKLELAYMAQIQAQNEWYATWGNGLVTTLRGTQDRVQTPVGVFRQIMRGANKFQYNIGDFRIDELEAFILKGFNKNRIPYSLKQVRVKTGRGGLDLARIGLAQKFKQEIPGLIQMNEFLTNKGGNNMQMGFRFGFDRFTTPLGDLEIIFEHVPELDNVLGDANQVDNPMLKDGNRVSSYCFIIDDITGQGGNIVKVVPETDNDFVLFHKDGKMPYYANPRRFAGDPSIPGFEVYITKKMHGYIVLDPQKVWMMVPTNPKTGSMFGANAYDRY